MSKNDGGMAFPIIPIGEWSIGQSGMTMRQYYKAAALMGMGGSVTDYKVDARATALECAKVADAMIAEDEEAAK